MKYYCTNDIIGFGRVVNVLVLANCAKKEGNTSTAGFLLRKSYKITCTLNSNYFASFPPKWFCQLSSKISLKSYPKYPTRSSGLVRENE